MARRHAEDTEAPTEEAPAVEPWIENGFRWLTNPVNGLLHRCPNNSAALGSFYGRGYVDAPKPVEVAPPAPSAQAWVEDGFRLLIHPETSGSNWVADRADALQVMYVNGWVDAEKPAPAEAAAEMSDGVVDEDGFRVLTHPGTGGTARVPNSPAAVDVWRESGWVDAHPAPAPEPSPAASPADTGENASPITENPADTATTEKE